MDCLKGMEKLENESIDFCMTSPPYWSLRDYGKGTESVWGGDKNCKHEWLQNIQKPKGGKGSKSANVGANKNDFINMRDHNVKTKLCKKCGAWKGQIGLEEHPNMFIEHLVEVFRELKRVLKKQGSFYLNLGDTYFGSGAGTDKTNQMPSGKHVYKLPYGDCRTRTKRSFISGWLQPKQLMLIPNRIAIALQEDGWLLRNDIIWHKPNAMPSSVKDRLNNTYEHVFHFVKSKKYYYDLSTIREPHKSLETESKRKNFNEPVNYNSKYPDGVGATQRFNGIPRTERYSENGKNPGDFWEICTKPFKGAHFAVYPETLCEKPIKSSCPPNGVVLDMFAGAGTTLVVAKKLGRKFIGFELNKKYVRIANKRLANVSDKLKPCTRK